MTDIELETLASLVHERNRIAQRITGVIGRPAQIGHIGEYIASRIFDIQLEESAVAKGIDGRFRSGQFRGSTVNVKFYGKREGLLDIRKDAVPDYYLVLTGANSGAMHSRGESRLWYIDWVFFFNGPKLFDRLKTRGVKIGTASSVIKAEWDRAEIFPSSNSTEYSLHSDQIKNLKLFSSKIR